LNQTTSSATDALTRSAFGFALLFFLPALLTWVAFLLSPVSPDATFAQLRTIIIVVTGISVLVLFALCVWLLRVDLERLEPVSALLVGIFGRAWLAWLVVLVLLEVNFIAGVALINVAPPFVQPARFLLASWSVVIVFIILTIHWQNLRAWLDRTSGVWLGLGISMVVLVVVGLLYILTSQAVIASGINNSLRGGLDYRPLSFIDDGEQPASAETFWLEQAEAQVRWSPYTYWVGSPVDGEYVNVDETGLRLTPQALDESDAEGHIFVFGGSTVWGEGARDAYTIPAHLARLLQDDGQDFHVTNYGQTGYVSTQDMLLFQLQLLRGNVPDVAIFYQGFNDTLAAYGENLAGVTLQESVRLSDAEAGRQLRQGQPLLSPMKVPLERFDMIQAATYPTSAESIFARWQANVDMVMAIANAYDVQVIFVWQPHIMSKEAYTSEEQAILQRLEEERPGFMDLYDDVDTLAKQFAQDNDASLVILSDLFAEENETIFHDLIHITEYGNGLVAEAILPTVKDILE
jgi:lysophospholipase L1-like esterase